MTSLQSPSPQSQKKVCIFERYLQWAALHKGISELPLFNIRPNTCCRLYMGVPATHLRSVNKSPASLWKVFHTGECLQWRLSKWNPICGDLMSAGDRQSNRCGFTLYFFLKQDNHGESLEIMLALYNWSHVIVVRSNPFFWQYFNHYSGFN